MLSFDLKSGYHHVGISVPDHRVLFGILVHGILVMGILDIFSFTVLQFGLLVRLLEAAGYCK